MEVSSALDLPLVTLLGAVRESVPVYGSGGFTSYSLEQLQQQLAGWVHEGISRVKMKVGTHPSTIWIEVRAVREAIASSYVANQREGHYENQT